MPRRRYRRSDSEDLFEALSIIEEELFRMERPPPRRRSPTRRRSPKRRSPVKKRKLSAWQNT